MHGMDNTVKGVVILDAIVFIVHVGKDLVHREKRRIAIYPKNVFFHMLRTLSYIWLRRIGFLVLKNLQQMGKIIEFTTKAI